MATSRRPLIGWGVGLLIAGVVLGLIAGIGGYSAVSADLRMFVAGSVASPGTVSEHLVAGRYDVLEKVGTSQRFGALTITNENGMRITAADVTVTSSTGANIPVADAGTNFTLSRGGSQYRLVVQFEIPSDGDYTVTVDTPRSRFLVTPALTSVIGRAWLWIGLLMVAGLLVVVGLVLVIVGAVRGRRGASDVAPVEPAAVTSAAVAPAPVVEPTPAALPPAGWFADPGGSGRWRWWDGQRWTDHLG